MTRPNASSGGERLAALGIVGEHIEARARRRKQHRIAALRHGIGARHRLLHRHRALDGHARSRERFGHQVRVAADEYHRARVARNGRHQRCKVLALAFTAGDEHDGLAESLERGGRGAHVRALRVVVEAHAARLGHELHAMGQALEFGERLRERLGGESRRAAKRVRRQCIGRVVQALQRHGVDGDDGFRAFHQVARARVQPPLVIVARRVESESHVARAARHRVAPRVSPVEDARLAVGEDALLGRRVILHGRVAVHVILREIQHRAGVELQAARGLELVARKFDDVDLGESLALALQERIEHRQSDVARDHRLQAGRARHGARERRHGGLAVGSGYAEHPGSRCGALDFAAEEFDVACDVQPARDGVAQDRLRERNARTRNDRIHSFQDLRAEFAEVDANSGDRFACRSQGRRRFSRVGGTHLRTFRREPANARKPRVTQTQNENLLAVPFMCHLPSAVSGSRARRGRASS